MISLLRRFADAFGCAAIAHLTAELAEAKAQLRVERRARQTQAELTARWRSIALTRAPKETTK